MYLPKDYGGDCQSMAEQNQMWVADICEKRYVIGVLVVNIELWHCDIYNTD